MWKLLEPRSTAASTSGTGRGAERAAGLGSAERLCVAAAETTRRCVASGGREGGAAAAGGGGIGVADHELRAVQALAVVDLRPGEVLHAHRVHDQLHAVVLDAGVPVLQLLVEFEAVLQPRAAAALHEDAQHQLRVALALNEGGNLLGGRVGEQERRCVLQRFGGAHKSSCGAV